jgi:ABC-type polysaccharide/polyol phosphate export permease
MKTYLGIADLKNTVERLPLIAYLSISDLKARYKRSVLGPLWLTLGTAVGAAGLGFLWSELFKIDPVEFVPALTSGLILWFLISSIILESSTLLSRNANIVKNIRLPISSYAAQLILRQIFTLAHTAPVFLAVAWFVKFEINTIAWMSLPFLFLVILNLSWISLLTAILGARFRDLEHLLTSAMPLLMMLSPVFYRPNYLPFSESIIWFNPLSHLIEVVRQPLLGSMPPTFVILTNLFMLGAGCVLTAWLFNKKYHRIPFWI